MAFRHPPLIMFTPPSELLNHFRGKLHSNTPHSQLSQDNETVECSLKGIDGLSNNETAFLNLLYNSMTSEAFI